MDRHIKLTRNQKEASEVWLFDPMSEPFPGTLSGLALVVKSEDLDTARRSIRNAILVCTDSEALEDLSTLANRL